MRIIRKTQKLNVKHKFTKSSQKLTILSALSALLTACGGGATPTEPSAKTTNEPNDENGSPSNSAGKVTNEDGANDGPSFQFTNGNVSLSSTVPETIIVIAGDGINEDMKFQYSADKDKLKTDISAFYQITSDQVELLTDVRGGAVIKSLASSDVLIAYGQKDFSNITLKSFKKLVFDSEIQFSHEGLTTLIETGLVEFIGSDLATLVINAASERTEIDLSQVQLTNIKSLHIGENVHVCLTQDQVNQLEKIIGDGSIENFQKHHVLSVEHLSQSDIKLVGMTDGDDIVFGSAAKEVMKSGLGNDKIDGGGGADIIEGGEGNDTLMGGDGDDVLLGGIGNDLLYGGDGEDELIGGAGDDILEGGSGRSVMLGEEGQDILIDMYHQAYGLYGGTGYDHFVVLGSSNETQYTLEDLQNPLGLDVDLTNAIKLETLNQLDDHIDYENTIYHGEQDGASFITFGNVDLTEVWLESVDTLLIHDHVTIDADKLNELITGSLKVISTSDHGSLKIVGETSATPKIIDMSLLDLSHIEEIELGANVTLSLLQNQLNQIEKITGSGAIKSRDNSELDFSNISIDAEITLKPLADTIFTGHDYSGTSGVNNFTFKAGDTNLSYNLDEKVAFLDGYTIIRNFETNQSNRYGDRIDIDNGSIVAEDGSYDGVDGNFYVKDGTDGGFSHIRAHNIENGIVQFDDQNEFAEAINLTNLASVTAAVEYLQHQDLGDAGTSLVFLAGQDSYLFIQGDDDGNDEKDIFLQFDQVQFDQIITEQAFGQNDLLLV